jgi:hypothetical protein
MFFIDVLLHSFLQSVINAYLTCNVEDDLDVYAEVVEIIFGAEAHENSGA